LHRAAGGAWDEMVRVVHVIVRCREWMDW
jgi:hypothetical protein